MYRGGAGVTDPWNCREVIGNAIAVNIAFLGDANEDYDLFDS